MSDHVRLPPEIRRASELHGCNLDPRGAGSIQPALDERLELRLGNRAYEPVHYCPIADQ